MTRSQFIEIMGGIKNAVEWEDSVISALGRGALPYEEGTPEWFDFVAAQAAQAQEG